MIEINGMVVVMLVGKLNGEESMPMFFVDEGDPQEVLARTIAELEADGYTDIREIDDEAEIFLRDPEVDDDFEESE